MGTDKLMFVSTLLLTAIATSHSHAVNRRSEPIPLLRKMDDITRHLRQLTTAMADFDLELRGAVSGDPLAGSRLYKRSTTDDEDKISCLFRLREDVCQALEMVKERENSHYLITPGSPGKRSEQASNMYQQMETDLRKKRELLRSLRSVFDNAGDILEHEKKWFTCKLNLGYTCQTQEYAAIADYYDFLNSPNSPGKKRAAQES